MKPLNIGMIGYGFMGRDPLERLSRKVNNFFDLEYQPVLKAVCAANAEKAKAFADKWGYESIETDWRKLIDAQGHRRDRHLHARTTCTRRSPSPRPRPAR